MIEAEDIRADHGEQRFRAPVNPEFWASARVVMPPTSLKPVSLRVDSEVLDGFRSQGKGHLTRVSAVLRSYVEVHRGGPMDWGEAKSWFTLAPRVAAAIAPVRRAT